MKKFRPNNYSSYSNQIVDIKLLYTLTIILVIGLLGSCNIDDHSVDKQSKFLNDFRKVDNLYKDREIAKVVKSLDSLKPLIASSDIESLTHYYIFRSQAVFPSKRLMNIYADSLLSLFADEKAKTRNKTEYIRALILKSDVLLYFKQYDKVVTYYFKVSNLIDREKDPTNYADFISKIAQIYYLQGKFSTAAKYQLDSYNAIQAAKDVNPANLFYYTQAALNNAGFSYERAEKLDSALYLYEKNLAYILNQEKKTDVSLGQVMSAKIVALDNIGGLYAKKGNLPLAKNYLEECIAINNHSAELSKITAYIKLAKVYSNTANTEKADSILNVTEKLVKSEPELSLENNLKLYKAKSELAYSLGNYKNAVENLKLYNETLDNLNKVNSDLSKVNIDQAFKNLEDQQALEYLEKINQSKTVYLIGAVLFGMMLLVIVWLVLKNAKQAKKAERETIVNNKELEKALLSLENRNKDYAKMMKVMAHDLKNPIGGMVGIASLLLEENERFTEEDKEMLQLIESSGANSIEMINQLLNSGLAIENEVLKKESIDLQQLLRQCTELLQYKADEKKQKIVFISSGPTVVSIAREKIWRVFNNLIVNAIKFSLPKTEIVVVLERLEKSVRVKIVDQGIGIPDTDKSKIFEMFTSAKRPGTAGEQPFGIGLSISKQIIENHNGKIWLEDNTDGGTIFYVELPIK
ncbi:MAG: tetratricopeptide repeat-containing sensor histidine kinase [Pedobacter sp.]|uniref:tetratricopeptide repeat-containing sensor histidine kinase n=1 Tax=Pedobacter sp. TaxID=1411316 RepID=UPI0028065D77|nr:tetratricopeptide repeat-containing sensor histidine kinase [Pedobacter sp.]MDQ8005311.1 tetratricopeptide repeat-containing sensor histidine kinase [Pedobacter sp.]